MIASTMFGAAGVAAALALGGHASPATGPAGPGSGAPRASATTAPVQLDTLTITYEVAGVKVIHRPVSVTDVVAVNLYLLGGSRELTPKTAGAEWFSLIALEYGTQRYPGEAARRALGHTGSGISIAATSDYTRFAFRGVKQEFDSTWAVFADRLMHPTLDSAAMAVTRGQVLRSIKSASESPDGHVRRIADSLAFESHPYAIPVTGTVASISALTAADVRTFMTEHLMTSRMLLVVVGDIPRAQVEKAVTATLGTLPRGSYTWMMPAMWPAKAPRVALVERRLPTNYILGYFSGPLQSSEEYPAFAMAVSLLGSMAGGYIRSEGLSYAAGAPLLESGASGGGIYVSTSRPDTVVKIINSAIELINQGVLKRYDILMASKQYISGYYYQTESNAELANVLAMAQLYRGDFRAAATHGDVLRKVAGSDIRSAARKYIKNIQYAYLGDTTRAPVKLMMKQP